MKRCPKCSRTFPDENQKFCTVDGGLLMHDPPAPTFDPNLTVSTTSRELPPLGEIDASEAPTSVQLPNMAATITSFGSGNVTPTGPTGAPTSADLVAPVMPAPTADIVPPAQPTSQPLVAPSAPTANIAPPAQPTSQPLAAPATPVAAPAPPKKKSAMPWIIVGLLVLLVLGGGGATAAYFFALKPWLEARNARTNAPVMTNEKSNTNNNGANTNSESPANTNSEPKKESIFMPPANAVKFENSKASLDGKLLDHYVDFSFYYLNSWAKDPKAGATSFVKVERRLPPDLTQENVAVGYYESKGTFELDKDSFPKLVESYSADYSKRFPNYRKISEGPTKVNSLDAYEFRFEGLSKGTEKGDIKFWGRAIFLPTGNNGDMNGVTLLMFTTSLAPELQDVRDVGVKCELPVILYSFRFGANH